MGTSMTEPDERLLSRRQLGAPQLKKLVPLFEASPIISDPLQRQVLLDLLPDRIKGAIPYNPAAHLHVINIIRACESYPNGISSLIGALELLDTNSQIVDPIKELVGRYYPTTILTARAYDRLLSLMPLELLTP